MNTLAGYGSDFRSESFLSSLRKRNGRWAVFMLDKEGRIETWNTGIKSLKGYDADEIIGRHVSIFYTQKDLMDGVVKKNMETAMTKGSAECMVCLVRKDGSIFWANVHYIANYDRKNQFIGFSKIARLMSENSANDSKTYHDAGTISAPELFLEDNLRPCVIFDRNWNYIHVSDYAAALNGRKPEDLLGKNLWLEFPEKKECEFYKYFVKAVEENEKVVVETYHSIWRKWFAATLHPSINGLFVHLQDITANKREAYRLYESNKYFRQIVESTQEGVWLIDANGRTTFVNRRMCEILEYNCDEMIGKESTFFMSDTSTKHSTVALDGRNMRVVENIELQLITKTGRHIWATLTANPVFDEDHLYIGLLAMVTDITDKKLLKRELENEQHNKQRDIAKAVENAHEKERSEIGLELHDNVQQILASSLLFIKLGVGINALNKDLFEKGLNYLNTAIDEIRKISHALTGPTKYSVNGLIDSVGKLVNDLTLIKSLKIDFRHDQLREVDMEPELKLVIYRIIQEQMSNILKHASATKVLLEIKKEDDLVTLRIYDNGKGFDPAAKHKGIGLKNIKNRVCAYRGTMSITSGHGKGVQMKIRFQIKA